MGKASTQYTTIDMDAEVLLELGPVGECFNRLRYKKTIPARSKTKPRAPPTIAPSGIFEEEAADAEPSGAGVVMLRAEGDVACRTSVPLGRPFLTKLSLSAD